MARMVLVLAIMFSLGLSACSSDDGGDETGSTGPPDATTGAPGAGCVDLTGEGSVFTITMSGRAFQPDCFTVDGSQTARIVNQDSVLHSFIIDGTEVDGEFEGGTTFHRPGAIQRRDRARDV